MSDVVDWAVAARVGAWMVPPGPRLAADERARVVAGLRDAAGRAADLVAEASGLPGADVARGGAVLVVDRPGIVRANAAVAASVLEGALGSDGRPGALDKAAGAGSGLVLGLIATRVLGQYEPFFDRLLLCAPSVEAMRASIGADAEDFALWVCLHEQTHRQQFAAAPWLRDYLRDLMRRVLVSVEGDETADGRPPKTSGLGLAGLASGAGLVLDEVTGVMSLMEGYAEMLMDSAGAAVIPTLPQIRKSFDERRRRPRLSLANLLMRAIGFGAKMDQYVVGKQFCETVRSQAGLGVLNLAFTRRDALPTVDELRDPGSWVTRVGGGGA